MIRNFMERLFRIKNKQEALALRRKLAIFYAIVGWNSFAVFFFVKMKAQIPDDPQKRREALGFLSGTPSDMHVYQMKGLSLTNNFDVTISDFDAKTDQMQKENEDANAMTDNH